jgi:general secretion pathway protein K
MTDADCRRRPMTHGGIRQRGMAVIGALVVVAAVSVITSSLMERQSRLAQTLAGERDRVQAQWLLRAGLDWARVVLFDDARQNAITRGNGLWTRPVHHMEIPLPGGRTAYFSGYIQDEQSKYNVTRLALNGQVQAQELNTLKKLMRSLQLPENLAPLIADHIAQTQQTPLGNPALVPLRQLDDLGRIEGMPANAISVLADYLTVLPARTTVNINTARAEVISASIPELDLAQAREVIMDRDNGMWFVNYSDFYNRLDFRELAHRNQLDVRSQWFSVTGRATLDNASVAIQALVHRPRNGLPEIRWVRH